MNKDLIKIGKDDLIYYINDRSRAESLLRAAVFDDGPRHHYDKSFSTLPSTVSIVKVKLARSRLVRLMFDKEELL